MLQLQAFLLLLGQGNIWGAAYTWDRANAFVKSFREQYDGSMWIDVKYEQLCREPEKVLRTVCEFPEGHPDEEIIVGFRAWKKWKKHFSIQRRYFR